MQKRRKPLPSPSMVVAVTALVFAVAGTSLAGVATISALSKKEKKQTRNIAKGEVNKLAPGIARDEISSQAPGLSVLNSQQLGGLSLRGLSQWVLVGSAGAVVSSSGGVTATDLTAAGRYRVSFPSSVANCGLNANAGASGPVGDVTGLADRMVMLARSTTGPNDVQVQTTDETGADLDNPFFLTVQC